MLNVIYPRLDRFFTAVVQIIFSRSTNLIAGLRTSTLQIQIKILSSIMFAAYKLNIYYLSQTFSDTFTSWLAKFKLRKTS